jgi:hypothetical protein
LARDVTGQRSTAALELAAEVDSVRCPFEPCSAEPGHPCVNALEPDRHPLPVPHWQRIRAAQHRASQP